MTFMSEDPKKTTNHQLGAKAVRALLLQQGHPKQKHTAVLADITGLSQPQANRKLSGASGWEVNELNAVCNALGASLIDVLEAVLGGESTEAVLACGEKELTLDITLDQQLLQPPEDNTLVAARLVGTWSVGTANQLGGHELWSIRKASLRVSPALNKPRCAVVDCNEDVAVSIALALGSSGFRADAFHSTDSLVEALKNRSFDAFVIDWPILPEGDTTLLDSVRLRCPEAVIALLASNRSNNDVAVAKLSAALRAYDAEYIGKPSPIPVIAAVLLNKLMPRIASPGETGTPSP
jgi:ActR/RegA family two-component response regulator